ncbi:MAG TPA: tetratricopeptide repeat protein, partial [bacterium]|nr:tetratricopeptide repeat protein [bacterium]
MSATTGPAIELLLTMGEELAGKDPARALECLRQAADLAAAAGDPGLESNALSDLGALAIAQGDYDAAGKSLERAIALAREGDDDLALARALNALGLLRKRQGAAEDGLAYLRESLGRTSEAAHDDAAAAVRAETLEYLGATYRDTGDAKQAFVYFQEALEIRRASGDEAGIASCRNQLGNLCYRMGQFQDAQRHYQLALETRRAAGDRSGTASTLNNLAGTAMLLGNLREAASLFEESLAITEELGDPHRIASLLSNIGLLRSYEGRVDEAESLFVAGLEIHRERGDLVGQAHALNNMSDLAVERGRPEEAIRLADECIRTWTRAGRSEALPKPWVNRGRALIELDRLAEARQAAREAIDAAART